VTSPPTYFRVRIFLGHLNLFEVEPTTLKRKGMSFSQIPFLGLLSSIPNDEQLLLLEGLSRITPLLIPNSILKPTLAKLPSTVEYYVIDDTNLSLDEAINILDSGAAKLISRDATNQLLNNLPPNRFILRLNSGKAVGILSNSVTLDGLAGVLLDAESFSEGPLKEIRTALNKSILGRPKDLFILSINSDVVLHQPAALKLLTKTVSGISVIPLEYLSTDPGNSASPQPLNGKLSITTLFTSALRTDRTDGLFPTLPISLASVPAPLGLVYSSASSIAHSIVTGNATYHSRSRNGLWKKGETSGAMQRVERIRMDCDTDALEFGIIETGPNGERDGFCHIPDQTACFGPVTGLAELEATLRARKVSAPAGSYTARLFREESLLRAKIMEEAGELCDAKTKEEIAAEAADLIYFALVKCVGAGVGLKDISSILDKRSLKITRRKGDAKPDIAKKMGLSEAQALGVVGGVESTKKEVVVAPVVAEEKQDLSQPKCQVINLADCTPARRAELHKRPVLDSTNMISVVKPIVDTVKNGGDEGLRSLVVKFDRCTAAINPTFPLVINAPFPPSMMQLDPVVKSAIDQAYHNIKKFHQAQMDKESTTLVVETMPGVICSRFARAIDRVGLYVPGGTAILPSTALMLATPAQVAKCPLIVLSTPPRSDGSVSPEIVYIASLTGVHHIVRAGGAQAVAAMAYGTESVPKVDKIFGPGNQFVTAAKMSVSMDSKAATAIDMPAGPSEVLVRYVYSSAFSRRSY
jgi:phosphoribosyl-ATP pyrophosphohydrolase/phosphoribosyl-AMP cyclohydrolase/histidinol dehydrogenase